MISSINSSVVTNSYGVGCNQSIGLSTSVAYDNKNIIEDSYSPDVHTYNDLFKLCTSMSVNSLDEYKEARNSIIDPSDTNESENINYKAEYREYIKSRGCSDEKELQALNKTGFSTKSDLYKAASTMFNDTSNSLVDNKFVKDNNYTKDTNKILSAASIDDVANFVIASAKPKATYVDKVDAFRTLIDKVSQQDNIDDSLKKELNDLSQSIGNSKEGIKKLSKEIEEKEEKEAKAKAAAKALADAAAIDTDVSDVSASENNEDNTANIQKYNASLISNYQN